MGRSNKILTNVVGGELSPLMYGRIDLPVFQKGLAKLENFIALAQGGAQFRTGTKFVHYTRLKQPAALIPFQFSDQQSYIIEATNLKFRFYKDNGIILEAAKNITGVTNANPGVVTSNAHGFSNGDEILIDGIVGAAGLTAQLNGKYFLVAGAAANTFTLTTIDGVPINTTSSGAYSSGGTASRVYEITTPYQTNDLPFLQYTQNADTMYIAHNAYEPRKLTRSGHTNWTLATYVRTADPFTTSNDWPRAVCFTDTGRIIFGGTLNRPETFYGSKAPTTGTTNYDNFTTGTNPTDAFVFTLAPIQGKVDSIQWLANTNKFLVAGTFGSIRRMYGSLDTDPISATEITAKSVDNYGCYYTLPVVVGNSLFYIQRGGLYLRSMEYDLQSDGYITVDRNLVAEHLTRAGIVQLVQQQGTPDLIWTLRSDGRLLGLTFKDKEDISGWHRHYLGGKSLNASNILVNYANVVSLGRMPRPTNTDQLWVVVARRINGQLVRSVEYLTDPPVYPVRDNFYTSDDTDEVDETLYQDALYEAQKDAIHLDMSSSYDGSAFGTAVGASVTPGAVTGAGVTFTASAAVFTAAMVGRQIWKKYDVNGNGGGRASITGFTNSTTVTCTVLHDFDSTAAIPAGSWFLTATGLTNLDYLEGETVRVIVDGGPHNDVTVTAGAVTLTGPASKVHVGYGYRGIIETLNIDSGGVTGTAQAKPRNLVQASLRLKDTIGITLGTSPYIQEKLTFRGGDQLLSRPVPPNTGIFEQLYSDSWQSDGKQLFIVQDFSVPCTVLSMDCFFETTDE